MHGLFQSRAANSKTLAGANEALAGLKEEGGRNIDTFERGMDW
jgi:hypothetical protein